MANIMEIQNLHYKYEDGTHALKGVDINLKKGLTTAVVGANGAGKSTLFLSMNGIYKPSRGQVLYNGTSISYSREGLKRLRKAVGIVFQDPDTQLFSASVYQDISFGVMNLKLPEKEVDRRVNQAIEKTGISHIKDKPTHSLSFGQKKRVAIAGILAMGPELLVMDEPTAGLDPRGTGQIMKLLKEAQRELGLSVVMATHDMDIVPIYCDYVYMMDEGKVLLEGTPKEVFSEVDIVRRAGLRLPRIGHLMEILNKKDDFQFDNEANTISEARKVFKEWKTKFYLKK